MTQSSARFVSISLQRFERFRPGTVLVNIGRKDNELVTVSAMSRRSLQRFAD
jgi:hypothetical protein